MADNGGKVFNRDVRLTNQSSLYVNEVQKFDGEGNVPASVGVPGATTNSYAMMGIAAAQQDIAAGGGAVNVTSYFTTFDTDAGGDALTLADGAIVGQLKRIQLIVDGGGDGVLTPTNLSGGTTITFADAGDYCILQWDGTNWVPLVLSNEADGVTAPVLA